MPSLRIPFPEKEALSTIVLKGPHITVGRRPSNTIQILDRTLSGAHAELVSEPDGHYRLHDLGSTNGTSVNGEIVTDFHLLEACTISFGSVACEFDPAAVPETVSGEAEVLATRSEMESLRHANDELNRNLGVLREEVAGLKGAQVAAGGEPELEILKSELQRVIVERGELKEAAEKQLLELARLQSELALVKRDRTNLQNALRLANGADLDRVKRDQAGQATRAPSSSGTLDMPAGAAPGNPTLAKPTSPVAPIKPLPAVSKPGLPPPSAPSLAQPAVQNGRPVPPPGVAVKVTAQPTARPVAQPTVRAVAQPTVRAVAQPTVQPTVRAVPQAIPKAPVAVPRPAGPTGTERITLPSSAQGPAQETAQHSAALAKLPPKFVPPVRPSVKPGNHDPESDEAGGNPSP